MMLWEKLIILDYTIKWPDTGLFPYRHGLDKYYWMVSAHNKKQWHC